MRHRVLSWLVWVVLASGCVADPAPSHEGELDHGAPADAAGQQIDATAREDVGPEVDAGLDDGVTDATPIDAQLGDAMVEADAAIDVDAELEPDAGPDAALEPDAEPELDAALEPDAEPDAALEADARPEPDAGPDLVVDAGVERYFVIGVARAADGRTPVTVRGGGQVAEADAEGRFRLGPLPPGPVELRFLAEAHQTELRAVEMPGDADLELDGDDGEVLLYRGVRLGAGADRVDLRFDEAWLIWLFDEALHATALPEIAPTTLLAADAEILLGHVPGEDAVVVRQRTEPGIAGDLRWVPLDGRAPETLFVEAQPWVRWSGGRAMAMVHTRDALSRLEVAQPGAEPQVVAEGVPWLLVTQLVDGAVAWASVHDDGVTFDVFVGDLDGAPAQRLTEPESRASDRFLSTTPGRDGLLWMTPEDTLWRWTPEAGAEALATEVLASPRPRFLADGRLLFWRAAPAGEALFIRDGPGEVRRLVTDASAHTYQQVGRGFFVVRPGAGLWYGGFDGPAGADVVPAEGVQYRVSFGGALLLADGRALRYTPGGPTEAVPGAPAGLSQLSTSAGGGTAWAAETQTLWWLPGPNQPGAAVALSVGADRPERRSAWGGAGLYTTDAEGWRRVNMPPDAEPDVVFDARLVTLDRVLADDVLLARDAERTLWQLDGRTGAGFGWARAVDRTWVSGRGGWAAYTCDRGLFVVRLR